MKPFLRLIMILILAALACQVSGEATQVPSSTALTNTGTPVRPGWFSVYFTDPQDPDSDSLRGGPDRNLADAIRAAQASVDVAVLQLDLWSIRDALIDAHDRGLPVRVVIESDYSDEREIQDLMDAGIEVLGDRREGLMHNKFVILDRQEVWTGSMNFTINDGYRNNNNLVRVRSRELAENYLAEFEEMFAHDQFGPGSPANTPNPSITVNGVRIDTCYAPDDGCAAKILDVLNSARDSIQFMAYSFTSDELAASILSQAQKGVDVQGVMEAGQVASNSGTEYQNFVSAGLDVRKDGNPRNMHHKVMIVDGKIVLLGSYNFTFYGDNRNDENLLIIYSPELAAQFQSEFEKVFATAQD